MYATRLPFFAVIRATGEDRHSFLHSQLSNDIANLAENRACYATYNTPKGRVIANMLVYNAGGEILLAVAADLAEALVKRLKMFVMRAKVQFEILSGYGAAAELAEDAAVIRPQEPQLDFAADNGRIALPHGGFIRIAPPDALPEYRAEDETAWQRHEILCGYPWISAATTESCVAQMLNQLTIGGVHFRKGCYPGQEVIARAQYRGQVKRGLAVAECAALQQAGGKVLFQGDEAGLVLNSAGSLNLLVIKHSAAQDGLTDGSGTPFALQHCFFATGSESEGNG